MDSSELELQRIVAFVNRRPWIMPEEGGSTASMDTLGITPQGDTSLLRLCAWHATLPQLKDYLSQYRDAHVTASNLEGVTCLHLAVYRNSYHASAIIQHLLAVEPALASLPMTCGSTPLHILCGHNVTIRKDVLMALLQADPSVVYQQDENGDTPLSLLWKNVQRFRWARQDVASIELDTHHSAKQNWVGQMMISPEQCLDLSLEMVRAARNVQSLSLADLVAMPRCPPLLIQLVLQNHNLLDIDLNGRDMLGRTALHYGCIENPMKTCFTLPIPMKSVLDALLEKVPCQSSVKDQWGRVPLHYALVKGSILKTTTLDRLVAANPDCLCTKDPITGLYPFALAAAGDKGQAVIDGDCTMEDTDESEHLSTIIRLLRRFPEAAIYDG